MALPTTALLGIIVAVVLGLVLIAFVFRSKPAVNGSVASKEKGASGIGGRKANGVANGDATEDKPAVRVLYGTQTGTAERFSKQLAAELRKRFSGATVKVQDIEHYKAPEQLQGENLVLFLLATYGDGEPTDNAAEFYTWLLKEAEAVQSGSRTPFLQVC
jgi:NADPH-ferrihemoprotein reductase